MEIPWVFDDDLGPLDMLNDSLKLLSNDYLPGVAAPDLGARCVALQAARQQLDALMAVTVTEADRAGVAANAGTRTIAQYLAARTHMSPDAARADLRVGVWVSSYAQLESHGPCFETSTYSCNGPTTSNGDHSPKPVPTGYWSTIRMAYRTSFEPAFWPQGAKTRTRFP